MRMAIGGHIYASGDYRATSPTTGKGLDGWKRPIVARRQRSLRLRYGGSEQHPAGPGADALSAALASPAVSGESVAGAILEVGCGGAANEPIIRAALVGSRYIGLDFAWPMVSGAKADHPGIAVVNGDATALPFSDRSVSGLVDGGMLIHVPRWQEALAESARVAERFLVLHTVTITEQPTTLIRKRAYGFWVPEVLYNREELVSELKRNDFVVTGEWPSIDYDLTDVLGITTRSQTWLCLREESATKAAKTRLA